MRKLSDGLTNKTINFENNTVIVEYAVTASGGNFLIDGEANATISFSPGIVYRFDLSDSSVASHPFKLSTTSDGSHNSGSEYTTGKTSNGSQGSSGRMWSIQLMSATSDILYYYCSSHSGMGGTITVFGSSYGDQMYNLFNRGAGISISGSGQISQPLHSMQTLMYKVIYQLVQVLLYLVLVKYHLLLHNMQIQMLNHI